MIKEGLMTVNFLVDLNILAEGVNEGDKDMYKDSISYSLSISSELPSGYPVKGQRFYFKNLTSFLDSGVEVTCCWFVQSNDGSWFAEIHCKEINLLASQADLLNKFFEGGWRWR